ncbi:MAG: hypothetical protein VYD90_10355 [Pseudomonadota bacterium]|nr:hypothetical protein [Pseudomonadota bacterium]
MSGAGAPYFDQRPGVFEATRRGGGPSSLPLLAFGRHGTFGWGVSLFQGGEVVAELSAEDAMALAIDIAQAVGAITLAESYAPDCGEAG